MSPPPSAPDTLAPTTADETGDADEIVVIGAGPAGLTAAYQLAKAGRTATVLEADDVVGGISRTPVRDGWRFDIGGHRFFTKVPEVEALWHELLPDDLLTRPRLSRIYYRGRFFDYPIRPANALVNLGLWEALRSALSFAWARVRHRRSPETLEDYIVANYGRRLYQHFFAAYNEKVWGVPASALSADWGAQRIKGMSLWSAVWEPVRARLFGRRRAGGQVTSLIEEFTYPRLGPGQLWESCADRVTEAGSALHFHQAVETVTHSAGRAIEVTTVDPPGGRQRRRADQVISSMPINHLIEAMDPPAPDHIRDAAAALRHRDFLTVALVVPTADAFPDNWIYIHEPDVAVGRIQNFGAWSPHMVQGDETCLGLEYFASIGDDLWSESDADLIDRARRELCQLGLAEQEQRQQEPIERLKVQQEPQLRPVLGLAVVADVVGEPVIETTDENRRAGRDELVERRGAGAGGMGLDLEPPDVGLRPKRRRQRHRARQDQSDTKAS